MKQSHFKAKRSDWREECCWVGVKLTHCKLSVRQMTKNNFWYKNWAKTVCFMLFSFHDQPLSRPTIPCLLWMTHLLTDVLILTSKLTEHHLVYRSGFPFCRQLKTVPQTSPASSISCSSFHHFDLFSSFQWNDFTRPAIQRTDRRTKQPTSQPADQPT